MISRAQVLSPLFALLLFSMPVMADSKKLTIQALPGGGATYTLDPSTTVTGTSYATTSVPSTFGGVDIGPIIGSNRFYTNGYTGTGTITYNVEAGTIWTGHETLGHVTSVTNTAAGALNEFDRHATWVGMLIGGRNGGSFPGAYQTGVASQTTLRSSGVATSWVGTRYAGSFNFSYDALFNSYTNAFANGDTINSSWGATGTTATKAGTDTISIGIDGLARSNVNATMVVSAGNSGSSADTVGSPGSGYNVITVGALQNNGSNGYTTIASFSSRGAQTYQDPVNGTIAAARAPVDIVAPGTNLTSAYYGGETGGNRTALGGSAGGSLGGPDYYSGGIQGTSFSAPIVAGGVSLMKSAAKSRGLPSTALDTRVVKAALLNAADKTSGWTNAQTTISGVITTTQSLDYAAGAGAMNLNKTYDQYLLGQTDIAGMTGGTSTKSRGWDLASVNLGGTTDVAIPVAFLSGTTFNATLDWFRNRTFTDASTMSDLAFANLNLSVWDSSFSIKIAESISLYNEVEHLSFTLPSNMTIGLRVSYGANLFGSQSSETYGLAWAGTLVPEPSALLPIGIICITLYRRPRKPTVRILQA